MRRFHSWPVWALRWLRSFLEWTGLLPAMLLEVYREFWAREVADLVVWWPNVVGVA